MTTDARPRSRFQEEQRNRTERFAKQALEHAGCQVFEPRGPHRILLTPPECGHVLELHAFLLKPTILTLKVMTSVVFPAEAVPSPVAVLLLEENDRLAYGSMRMLRYGAGRMLVHGIVLDTLVLSNPKVAGVISRALMQQTRDVIARLVSGGYVKPGPLIVLDRDR